MRKPPHSPHVSGKVRIMAAQSQFPRPSNKQSAKKNLIRSAGWLCSAESLELAPRGELIKSQARSSGASTRGDPLVERAAVPARGFADRTRAVSDPASPALRPVREELANKGVCNSESRCRLPGSAARSRKVPRRSAERRARPQADDRGNADHPWRAPHWLAGSDALIRSAGADSTVCAVRRSASPYFLEAAFVQWLGKTRAQENAPRE